MTLSQLVRYFLGLGTTGFGGPIALVGYMQRDLVDTRGWYTAEELANGLALAQTSPGPLAAQLALYLGWLRYGTRGATLVGVAFIAPSFLMVLGLSVAYVHYGTLGWLRPAFAAVAAAVVGILARSAVKLGRMTLAQDWVLWTLAAANAVGVLLLQRESLLMLIASGLVVLGIRTTPVARAHFTVFPFWFFAAMQVPFVVSTLAGVFFYFAVAGTSVFGSGLAIVPYLFHGVVQERHWLTEQQFLDAIAVSMITPGPVVITVAFIGYLVAGVPGATAASLGVFLPVWLVVVIVAPHFERVRRNATARLFFNGVTAAATGAIAGAAILLSTRVLTDIRGVVIAVVVTAAVASRLRVPEPLAIVGAGVIGAVFG